MKKKKELKINITACDFGFNLFLGTEPRNVKPENVKKRQKKTEKSYQNTIQSKQMLTLFREEK